MGENNQLEVIVQQSGLAGTKAQVLLEKFSDYFKMAADAEAKAKTIIVTDESQVADMKLARSLRLHIREKRLLVEKTRKELKEQSLREGKAIDGIANALKAVIVPIEEHLDKQEHFVEIREKERLEQIRLEEERKAEEERRIKEEAERKERERIREENRKLREEKAAKEKELRDAEFKLNAERQEKEDAEKRAVELEKKLEEPDPVPSELIECPKCHHKFNLIERG